MPKHVHESHNAKARQSTAGSRKKGKVKQKRDDVNQAQAESSPDPNAEILIPKPKEQKDLERKERLRAEVCGWTILCYVSLIASSIKLIAQSDTKWTSKKKKRLEKYIVCTLTQTEFVLLLNPVIGKKTEEGGTSRDY
jgi:ATP-dependent RNA helicase DHX37/DHR1